LTAIATSIQHENLDWLGNIPLKSMIELRESDFLQDFRTSFRLARKRMTLQEGADFNKMAKDVENAIEKAISDNQADIADLEKQAKVKIINATGSFLTKTGLSIASTWIPPLAIVGMISDTAGYAKEIIETRKLAKDLPDRLKRGPWGLMIDAKQKEQK
jgi:pyruvate/2-oxoglutarate dehydrogenase complex dihydrolipoamide dehydrogenase (E3) component